MVCKLAFQRLRLLLRLGDVSLRLGASAGHERIVPPHGLDEDPRRFHLLFSHGGLDLAGCLLPHVGLLRLKRDLGGALRCRNPSGGPRSQRPELSGMSDVGHLPLGRCSCLLLLKPGSSSLGIFELVSQDVKRRGAQLRAILFALHHRGLVRCVGRGPL